MKISVSVYIESQCNKMADSSDVRYLESDFYTLEFESVNQAIFGIMEDKLTRLAVYYAQGYNVNPVYHVAPIVFESGDTVYQDVDYIDEICKGVESKWHSYVESVKNSGEGDDYN